jgi:hypothetical protein
LEVSQSVLNLHKPSLLYLLLRPPRSILGGGLEVGKMKVEKIVKRVEGAFDGIACADIEEPSITVVSYYPTVRYGYLPKFKLLVPRGARVTKVTREWYSERFPGQPYIRIEYIVEHQGQVWYFTLCRGDAMEPDYMYQGMDKFRSDKMYLIQQVWQVDDIEPFEADP